MRLLRDLSIAMKLGLASATALALLAGLVWSMLQTMTLQQVLDDRMLGAHAAENGVQRARLAVRGMRVAGQDLQLQQTIPGVDAATAVADREAAGGQKALETLVATADGPARDAVRQAITELGVYRGLLGQKAALRSAMLQERDGSFMVLQSRFESTLQTLRRELPLEDLAPSEMEELQEHLRLYQESSIAMRDATNRFLATEDGALQERVTAADTAAASHMPGMSQARVSAEFKETVEDVAKAGAMLRRSAALLFERAAGSAALTEKQANPAAARLEAVLAAAGEQFDARAAAARQEADAAASASRHSLLLLSASVAAVLALSGMLTARAVARPIAGMTRSVQRMAEGEAHAEIGFAGRRDEVGRMAAALEVLRQAVQRNFVQGQMIEQLPIGLMTADATGEQAVSYMNQEARRLLTAVQAHLPVDVAQLVGRPVGLLHHELAAAGLGDAAALPRRLRIALGAETLEVSVSPLRRPDGAYAGPMLTWHVLTGQLQLSRRFERSVAGIVATVGEGAAGMRDIALAMSGTAEDSSRRLRLVAGASSDAAGNVHAVAASAEQLAHSVDEIARRVAESSAIAGQAVAEAQATDLCVAGLSEAASRIGDVVKLIGDIAGRTNLLALNATIEAARAGEAGRGFAVVAGEVKTLANQTAKATGEIASQITAMQGATGQAITALRSIGGTIQRMNEIATAIAGAVEEQGAATQEIARSVQQAAAGTSAVDGNIGELTEAVNRTGAQANEVVDAASRLSERSGLLSHEVADFLAAMQAA